MVLLIYFSYLSGTNFPTRVRTCSWRLWLVSTTSSSPTTLTRQLLLSSSSPQRPTPSMLTPSRDRPSPSNYERPWTKYRQRLGRRYMKQHWGVFDFVLLLWLHIIVIIIIIFICVCMHVYSGNIPDGKDLLDNKDNIKLKRCIYASQVLQ